MERKDDEGIRRVESTPSLISGPSFASPGMHWCDTQRFPSSESPAFSPLVYPSPIPAKTSAALARCPNPKGLVAFTPTAISLAVRETSQIAMGGRPITKIGTDPSFWPSLAALSSGRAEKPTPKFPRQEVIKGVPAAPGATIVTSSCGIGLRAKSEVINVVPLTSATVRANCNDCTADYYYIDRLGHVLLYQII